MGSLVGSGLYLRRWVSYTRAVSSGTLCGGCCCGDAPEPCGRAYGGGSDRLSRCLGARFSPRCVRLPRSHRRLPPSIRTGAAALIGPAPATVLERIANHEGVGCVRIDGEVWTARSYDEDEVIDAGERVEVVEIRGATALGNPLIREAG